MLIAHCTICKLDDQYQLGYFKMAIKLAANISFMFKDLPCLERFEAAAKSGEFGM